MAKTVNRGLAKLTALWKRLATRGEKLRNRPREEVVGEKEPRLSHQADAVPLKESSVAVLSAPAEREDLGEEQESKIESEEEQETKNEDEKEVDGLREEFIPLIPERENSALKSSTTLSSLAAKLHPFRSLKKEPAMVGTISSAYDLGQEYRVMAWNARLLSMGFSLSLLVNLGLGLVCVGLFPLKELQPFVLALQDSSQQVLHLEPVLKNVKGMDMLMEGLCRQYVLERETIDTLSEKDRWKKVYYLCSDEIWGEFMRMMEPKDSNSLYKQHVDKQATRAVHILVSSRIGEGVYQVEWESLTCIEGLEVERKRWVSTLEIETRPNQVKKGNEFDNPIGFTVVGYRISKRADEMKGQFS